MPFNQNLTVKTITASLSPYTVSLLDDLLLVDTSGGAVSIVLLPTLDYVKHQFDVIKTTSDASAVTLTVSDGSLINGAASYTLSVQNQGVHLVNDGTGAYHVNGGILGNLTSLASTQLIVGSSAGVPTARTVTGDVTIGNTGVTAIGAGKVTGAMRKEGKAYDMVVAATNGTTPVNVFGAGGAPTALVVTGVFVISKDTTAGNIVLKQGSNTVCTIAKGTSAGVLVGATSLSNNTYAASDVCTVESSSAGDVFVFIAFTVV